jgi:hypothetical protein
MCSVPSLERKGLLLRFTERPVWPNPMFAQKAVEAFSLHARVLGCLGDPTAIALQNGLQITLCALASALLNGFLPTKL